MRKDSKDATVRGKTNILGIRKGPGPDQYGGSFSGGQSAGGAYANARQSSGPSKAATATYKDHASQKSGPENVEFKKTQLGLDSKPPKAKP